MSLIIVDDFMRATAQTNAQTVSMMRSECWNQSFGSSSANSPNRLSRLNDNFHIYLDKQHLKHKVKYHCDQTHFKYDLS